MIGNVWEWVSDWSTPNTTAGTITGIGGPPAQLRVVQGGSWATDDVKCCVVHAPQGAARHVRLQRRLSYRVQRVRGDAAR